MKIGIIALAEKEWMNSLSCIHFEDITYESYIETSKNLAIYLKNDCVINFIKNDCFLFCNFKFIKLKIRNVTLL